MSLVYKMLKAPTLSRASLSLCWLCLQQGIWMYPSKLPSADRGLSALQFAYADQSCGISHDMQSPPVLSILCR